MKECAMNWSSAVVRISERCADDELPSAILFNGFFQLYGAWFFYPQVRERRGRVRVYKGGSISTWEYGNLGKIKWYDYFLCSLLLGIFFKFMGIFEDVCLVSRVRKLYYRTYIHARMNYSPSKNLYSKKLYDAIDLCKTIHKNNRQRHFVEWRRADFIEKMWFIHETDSYVRYII